MGQESTTSLILITTLTVIVLVVVIIVIFSIFQNRKVKYISEKREAELRFEEEIIKSQLETKEQTLKNISWELHDNIGQLLSVAKMQLNMIQPSLKEGQKTLIDETGEIISRSLQEIRTLSKLLNPEVIRNMGLEEALQLEVDRFNRLNFIKATMTVDGTAVKLDQKDEIILFRILQEFLSNSVKHSKTTKLNVSLNYKPNELQIIAQDFGVGFDMDMIEKGSGLINMRSRAQLIGSDLDFKTEKDKGVSLTLTYPLKN